MHTSDVPADVLEALRRCGLWRLRQVEYLHGSHALGNMENWHGIFTKLRAFSLVEYEKVLFLDLDMLVLDSLDALFDLTPPAAMVKGRWQPDHGTELDGRFFFPPEQWNEPHGGINAGVMLLRPDQHVHDRMEQEVADKWHPEHIYAYGPEQEYLSRFFADRWTQVSSRHNFQLFRFSASQALRKLGEVPPAAAEVVASLAAVQFSSHPKPWAFAGLSAEATAGRVADSVAAVAADMPSGTSRTPGRRRSCAWASRSCWCGAGPRRLARWPPSSPRRPPSSA
ncbi:unnamed protein product [Prorocentrum cordatum]|uniref:Hexosyltransferase n=1 Tax=Prorocentrum cordatum TaxID=2364126 RepID=A0ABN9SA44_9DINO|nr:unnamed protein product [Polarella glacialis]